MAVAAFVAPSKGLPVPLAPSSRTNGLPALAVAPAGLQGPQGPQRVASCAFAGLAFGVVAAGAHSRRRRYLVARNDSLVNSQSPTSEVKEVAERCLLNNYGQRGLCMIRGESHYLFEADGKKYLDFTSGIAVNCLGHSDPGWVKAVQDQAGLLVHTSNLFLNPEQVSLGEKLVLRSFADKAFFCNSGTEANEAAIKFARKFHQTSGKPREKFVAFENAFHGRTMGALTLTWKEGYKKPFAPLMPSSEFLTFNDPSCLSAIDESVCGVFVEPMQGEGGVIPGTQEFMAALKKRCQEVGALLIFDEVQCGLGRTGKLFAYQQTGVEPDLLTLAKPLAGGLPIGAVLMREKIADCINPGDHGSTFAGAPFVCRAANYTLDRVSDASFLDNVTAMGERLREGLRKLAEPRNLQVRGLGLLNGIVFPDADSCGAVFKAAQAEGLLVLTAGAGNVLRIAPALTVGAEEIDAGISLMEKAFAAAESS